jgi:hypothetical protein
MKIEKELGVRIANVLVNVPGGEIDFTDDPCDGVEDTIRIINACAPIWTSIVITLVKRRAQ